MLEICVFLEVCDFDPWWPSLQHVRLPELSRIQLLNKAPEVAEVHGSS
jgi:hypothetical protein